MKDDSITTTTTSLIPPALPSRPPPPVPSSTNSFQSLPPTLLGNNNKKVQINEDENRCHERRNKIIEYSASEERQANLCKNLAGLYKKFEEENKIQKICDSDELSKIFYPIIELEKVAQLVHGQVAIEIKDRIKIWNDAPYFGDILTKYFHFYKVYKSILQRYTQTLSAYVEAYKKPKFQNLITNLLTAEAAKFENITRLDVFYSKLGDIPRRYLVTFQEYIKLVDKESKEYDDISKVVAVFLEICGSSNESIDKMANFQECYKLQLMIEPAYELISDNNSNNRQLIKHGDLKKISRRTGEKLARHLILMNDVLLICGCDSFLTRKKYTLKYDIKVSTITIIENSDPENDLIFRIISPEQNNEFLAEDSKDKDGWIKAFKKLTDIKFDTSLSKSEIENFKLIGEIPPTWVKDNSQTYCLICKSAFTTIKRRHHCRTCGKIFCGSCCNLFIPVKFDNYRNKQRVCKICFNLLSKSSSAAATTTTTTITTTTPTSTISTENGSYSSTSSTKTLVQLQIDQLGNSFNTTASSNTIDNSDTSNQSINDTCSDSTSTDNVDANNSIEKNPKFQNELKNLLRNKANNKFLSKSINNDKRLSCNDTSSTTTTTTTTTDTNNDEDDEDIDDEEEDLNGYVFVHNADHESDHETGKDNNNTAKTTAPTTNKVNLIKEAFIKNQSTAKLSVTTNTNKNLTSSLKTNKQVSSASTSPTTQQAAPVRKRSMPNMGTNMSISTQPNILYSDSVLVSKQNLNKIENDDNNKQQQQQQNQTTANKIWERNWIVLTDDRVLTIYPNKTDSKQSQLPNNLIYLNNFELINKNESTFELKRKETVPTAPSLFISNNNNTNNENSGRTKTKSFISLFEYTNYEFKLVNQDNKNKLFNAINDLINKH